MVMTTTIPIPAIAAAPEVIQAGAPDGLLEAVPLLMGFSRRTASSCSAASRHG